MYNVQARGITHPNVVVGMAVFCGGLAQLLAGMWEFPKGNTFGATGGCSSFHLIFIFFLLFPRPFADFSHKTGVIFTFDVPCMDIINHLITSPPFLLFFSCFIASPTLLHALGRSGQEPFVIASVTCGLLRTCLDVYPACAVAACQSSRLRAFAMAPICIPALRCFFVFFWSRRTCAHL